MAHYHDVIAYAYEAALHCPGCARERFRATLDDEGTEDAEGNPITAVFAGDDGHSEQGEVCDECHGAIVEPAEVDDANDDEPRIPWREVELWSLTGDWEGARTFADTPDDDSRSSGRPALRRLLLEYRDRGSIQGATTIDPAELDDGDDGASMDPNDDGRAGVDWSGIDDADEKNATAD